MTEERKKRKKAAAIQYKPGEAAPELIAKGNGVVADHIVDKAEASAVPIYRDEQLVNELTKLDIGDFVPPELYMVIAEILVFVTDLDKMRDKMNG